METQSIRLVVPKVVGLTVLLYLSNLVGAWIAGVTDSDPGISPAAMAVALLFVSAVETIVMSYVIIRSRWSGWRLVAAVFVVFYGVKYFQSNIEALVFLQEFTDIIPAETMPDLFLMGLITAALFSPLAVLIHGKMKAEGKSPELNYRLVMPRSEWAWKLIVIAIVYVIIYLSFGALVFQPLAGEAFQEYYGDLQLPAWFIPFQLLRGLIWAALAFPVIRMMKGDRWETAVAVALVLSVVTSAQLFLPTAFMPETIRMAHFVELLSSQFVFGWMVVWLFYRHHGSLRELYR